MPANSSVVHIYGVNDLDTVLGGTDGVTNVNFYCMIEFICFFHQSYFLKDEGSRAIYHPLQSRNYYIAKNGKLLAYVIKEC